MKSWIWESFRRRRFSTRYGGYNGAGGISISASHNRAEWNALKFFGKRGTYLSTAESGELLDIYHLRKFDYRDWTAVGNVREITARSTSTLMTWLGYLISMSLKRFRVVVDCCNGTSSTDPQTPE